MSADLTRLLEEAVPEPPRALDPGAVLGRARRRRRNVRAAAAGALAALVVAGVAGGLATGDDRRAAPPARPVPTSTAVPGTYSVLARREPLPEEALPPLGGARLVQPGWASPAGRAGRYQVFLAETTDGGMCVVTVDVPTGGAGSGCVPPADRLTYKAVQTFAEYDGGPVWLVVPVPDGYTRAEAGEVVAVRDNLAVVRLRSPGPSTLRLTGPGLPTVEIELGEIRFS